ncbi:MAG TPA: glycosyltransferase family 2 protein [Aggregatilineales bacterium]|nr:glycosyltransferase family 2 protein [Aggregatilineales bacterium]
MSDYPHSLTLFYPMYNERQHLGPMTHRALEALSAVTENFEILIIDDGSTDGSEKLAEELARTDPRIKVIHHERNQGYGQALRTGWACAHGDIVMYTDCDEPVDLALFGEALPHLEHFDVVIGYRTNRWEGWRRFFYSRTYNLLVRILFGVRARDINFSFKLIWQKPLRKLNLAAGSVFIDGEFLSEAARNHLTVYEMPVDYIPRKYGVSNFNSIRAATYTFEEMWAYWRRRRTFAAVQRVPSQPTSFS